MLSDRWERCRWQTRPGSVVRSTGAIRSRSSLDRFRTPLSADRNRSASRSNLPTIDKTSSPGTPGISATTIIGSGWATAAMRSNPPGSSRASSREAGTARLYASRALTARNVKALFTSARSRLWSGGSSNSSVYSRRRLVGEHRSHCLAHRPDSHSLLGARGERSCAPVPTIASAAVRPGEAPTGSLRTRFRNVRPAIAPAAPAGRAD